MQEEGEEGEETVQYWYNLAANHGSSYASYLLWQENVKEQSVSLWKMYPIVLNEFLNEDNLYERSL